MRTFESAAEFRQWLEQHHSTEKELLVAFDRAHKRKGTLTYKESVDEALCFGWIDGLRKSLDAERYTIRFTPRKPRSTWSLFNIQRVKELMEEGRMRPAGLAAFEAREEKRSGTYTHEQGALSLSAEHEARLRAVPEVWAFWERQPLTYRRTVIWWLSKAKHEPTRERRLEKLIEFCRRAERLPQFVSPPGHGR